MGSLISMGIAAGLFDVAVSLGHQPLGLTSLAPLARVTLVSVGMAWVLLAGIWLPTRWVGAKLRLPLRPLLAAVSGLVLAALILFPLSNWRALASPLPSVLATLVSLAAALAGFLWTSLRPLAPTRRGIVGLPLFALALLGVSYTGALMDTLAPPRRAASSTPPQIWPAERPRVAVLITPDSLRADVLGPAASGAASSLTLRIDELARAGVSFLNARSTSAWTKPAFASMLTGVAPGVHGVDAPGASLDAAFDTLAERLQRAGYRTGAVTSNPNLLARFGFAQGFDDYIDFPRPSLGRSVGAVALRQLDLHREVESTSRLADLAIEWIQRHREAPFFFWLHTLDPHLPYAPPPEFLDEQALSEEVGRQFADLRGVRRGRVLSREQREAIRGLYHAEVRYVDREVGRVLDTLRELGLYDEAVVVLTSDHGEEFWEHGGFEHGHTLYDELLRVPLVVKLPRSHDAARAVPPSGRTVARNVSIESVAPTLLELLGLASDAQAFSSPSLLPWLDSRDGEAEDAPAIVFGSGTNYFQRSATVVVDSTKYIEERGTGRRHVFRLDDDPGEQRSLGESCRSCVARARRLLDEHAAHARAQRRRLGVEDGQSDDEDGQSGELERELQKRLRSLGYVE